MNDTHMVLFSLTLLGVILLFAVALHRKHDEWNEAVTRINQLDAEVQRLRSERNGLKVERDFLRDENAVFHAVTKPTAKAPAKKIVARKRSRKAVE